MTPFLMMYKSSDGSLERRFESLLSHLLERKECNLRFLQFAVAVAVRRDCEASFQNFCSIWKCAEEFDRQKRIAIMSGFACSLESRCQERFVRIFLPSSVYAQHLFVHTGEMHELVEYLSQNHELCLMLLLECKRRQSAHKILRLYEVGVLMCVVLSLKSNYSVETEILEEAFEALTPELSQYPSLMKVINTDMRQMIGQVEKKRAEWKDLEKSWGEFDEFIL